MIQTMDEPDEQLDLVDENDTPIGRISRREIPLLEESKRGYTRAVGVFIINDQGRLWTPRRQSDKKIAPNGLDFSAGEHVGHEESYESAALRGLEEELAIIPDSRQLNLVGTIKPFKGIPYFHKIFLYHTNENPSYNPKDYSGYEWFDLSELEAKLLDGERAKEILLPSIQLLAQHNLNGAKS